tara:strand:- start:25595 stop:25753 length:159 start_codon:yes stop_codon:yes gene_type:complete
MAIVKFFIVFLPIISLNLRLVNPLQNNKLNNGINKKSEGKPSLYTISVNQII